MEEESQSLIERFLGLYDELVGSVGKKEMKKVKKNEYHR